MKNVLFVILLLFVGSMAVKAQHSQDERLKNIRAAYAKAKELIADNGKGGNPALDMHVDMKTVNKVDEDFIIEDETSLDYYFTKKRRYNAKEEMFYEADACYFIIERWGANGHTRYREMLFDSDSGKLMFAYTKSETHAGFVTETRSYYDSDGKPIEEKHKAGGKSVDSSDHLYGNAKSDWVSATYLLGIFTEIMEPQDNYTVAFGSAALTQTKEERITAIRASYAKSRQQMEANKKSDTAESLSIVVHDQEEGECPPVVTEIDYSFSLCNDGEAPMYRCYFISEHRHHNNMGYDQYSEFLLDDSEQRLGSNGKPAKAINPMFTYTCVHEEGEKYEWRYYFDANGTCIETKSNHEDTDGGKADKIKVHRLLHVFNALMNSQQ